MKAEIDLNRLGDAMYHDRRVTRIFREQRVKAARAVAGDRYSTEGADKRVLINLPDLFISIVSRNLIANNPRVMLNTFNRQVKAVVSAMQDHLNDEINRIKLANTLRRCVIDALYSIGVAKVALADPALAATVGWGLAAGQANVWPVDLDDLCLDTRARDLTACSYIAHRYRCPLDVVKQSKYFNKSRLKLEPTPSSPYNYEGDERIKQIGEQYVAGQMEEFEDMVDLWEVYLPRHRLVVTLPHDYVSGAMLGEKSLRSEALREQRWIGPDSGPYHFLGFKVLPGNLLAKGPLMDLLNLSDAANQAFRKLLRQSERTKTITLVQGGTVEDVEAINSCDDGMSARVTRPDSVKQITFGSEALQPLVAVVEQCFSHFNRMAGNLEMLGGLAAQSKTATQDKMLNENSSRSIADMQDQTMTFTTEIVTALLWYIHHDPLAVQTSNFSVPGLPEATLQRKIMPKDQGGPGRLSRDHSFEEMKLQVSPYSLARKTPESVIAAINQVVQSILLPMMPILQQQGSKFMVDAYLQKVAQYMDLPDLHEIVGITEPPRIDTERPGAAPEPGAGPAETTRNYVRENVPGRTEQGDRMNRINAALGVNPGGAQRNGEVPTMGGKA